MFILDWPRASRSRERRICAESEYPFPLLAVAGYRLSNVRRGLPLELLSGPEWASLLAGAERHRVTGLLLRAVAEGAVPTSAEQRAQARAVHRAGQLRVMALEAGLVEVLELLRGLGIDARVLKGSALAHLDYPDPALRSFVDLDILVRARDIDRTIASMGAVGFTRAVAEPHAGFDRRFEKAVPLVSPSGFELDVHRTLVLGPWGVRIDVDDLWADAQEFDVAGHTAHALAAPTRFVHACYHALLGDWPLRLGSLRDVAEMLPKVTPYTASIRRLAASWGAEAVVASAISDAERLLAIHGRTQLSEWAVSHRSTREEVSRLALHTHADKTFAAQAVSTLAALPRWRDRLAYARALACPDAAYTAGRHSSALARLRAGVRQARRGRGK
jgi:hypothetical protein